MRLNAFLAAAGVASRRKADELIKSGRVEVNGQTGQLNTEVSEKDLVKSDGKIIRLQKKRYILLNKPAGYVTTLRDPQGRPTVIDLVGVPERIVPVGRLDFDTTGVLLLTNDGNLANQLMHPSHEVDKIYEATVKGNVTADKLEKIRRGINSGDWTAAPAKAKKIAEQKVELIIHEGRKHQVKKMLAAVGLSVTRLHRSVYAGIGLEGLKQGQWRELTAQEIKMLE